jgi:hypothetical protein
MMQYFGCYLGVVCKEFLEFWSIICNKTTHSWSMVVKNHRRPWLSLPCLRQFIVALIVFAVFTTFFYHHHLNPSSVAEVTKIFYRSHSGSTSNVFMEVCRDAGEGSAAPVNDAEVTSSIIEAVEWIKANARRYFLDGEPITISTVVNKAAAKYNLPAFLDSMSVVSPPMIDSTIVLCTDDEACTTCRKRHLVPNLCLPANLGAEEEGPASGGRRGLNISQKPFRRRKRYRPPATQYRSCIR